MDTIVSISTPLGSGAVGIVRMSGDKALDIAREIFKPYQLSDFSGALPNMMYLGVLNCGGINDIALAVLFSAPRSYTGEDVVELHCHGGISLVKRVYSGCVEKGARAADRGEFTRRAFLNGKLALSDAEGVADMINGDSAAAINAGYRLATGKTSTAVLDMERRLLDSISYLEASLDYPEEMEEESRQDAQIAIKYCLEKLSSMLATCNIGRYVKDGIKVAIVGVTNVGKSSLFNALVGRDRAIVTDIAGTTRDSIDEVIEVDGVALRLIDTAGIRKSSDTVENAGIERARSLAQTCDIAVFVTDGSRETTVEETALLADLNKNSQPLVAVNKCDLECKNSITGIKISAKTGFGIENLKRSILQAVMGGGVDESAELITSQRHKDALIKAKSCLDSAIDAFGIVPTECTLLDMRSAYRALGEITGDTADEGIIDNIFAKFCLGK